MLFFQNKKIKQQHSTNGLHIQKNLAPLQVRTRCMKPESSGKRALSWVSGEPVLLRGSLALEAALGLSLFLFLCVCLMMPLKMMDRYRQIQGAVEAVGEDLSQYGYVLYAMGDDAFSEKVDTEREEGGLGAGIVSTAYAAASVLGRINGDWIEKVSFAGTTVGEDDMIHIRMAFSMRLPFSVFGLKSLPMEAVCSRRIWNGAEGGRGGIGDVGEGGEEDEIVYIGKSPTRYHRKRTCHYLYNDLKQVPASQIQEIRNQEGKRYQACRSCGASASQAVYYVMPYGTSYHTSGSCRAITAYVQAVPLKEVSHLGECSYCGN